MYNSKTRNREEEESNVLSAITGVADYELVLYNDDYNTFEHVIN